MTSRIRFGTVRGVDMFVHWTFLLMLVGIFVFYVYQGVTIPSALMGVGLILAIFGCVVLHELGHAFMAREFGIPTLDITMYPIGGVARLQRMPREPKQEFLIAIAGPAVNLAIAGLLFLVNSALEMPGSMAEAMTPGGNVPHDVNVDKSGTGGLQPSSSLPYGRGAEYCVPRLLHKWTIVMRPMWRV